MTPKVITPPSPPPGTRSQHLPPSSQGQVTTPPSLPPGPGHNTSLPPLGPGHNTSFPPPPGPGHNTSLPPPRTRFNINVAEIWTSLPPPWDQVTTPPSLTPPPPPGPGHNTSLPPSPPPAQDQVTTPPSLHPGLCAGGRYASYWNAFLFLHNNHKSMVLLVILSVTLCFVLIRCYLKCHI